MSPQQRLIQILEQQGITHPQLLAAFREIPRERFVLPATKKHAYENTALAIDCAQTISQPYIIALMTQALMKTPAPKKVLEIGTGSGYQTAILATLFPEIWTIERIPTLQSSAQARLTQLGYHNIHYRLGDGWQGWAAAAPFDAIIVTAAAATLPPELLKQLAPNGTLIIPLGRQNEVQQLTQFEKQNDRLIKTVLEQVAFVPLIPDEH